MGATSASKRLESPSNQFRSEWSEARKRTAETPRCGVASYATFVQLEAHSQWVTSKSVASAGALDTQCRPGEALASLVFVFSAPLMSNSFCLSWASYKLQLLPSSKSSCSERRRTLVAFSTKPR